VPGLLGPELRWAYRSSARLRAEPLRLATQVVVTDVHAPAELHLPALRQMRLGSARTVEGAMATPDGVLNAIADAELVVINAHGVTDANEPSAASLVLSPDPKTKGSYWLTAERVRQARLSRSPVVILAACHAGRVQVSAEPWSLASSFLAAGARAVIAPTTEIPDQDANEVFEAIIGRMQAGSSPERAVAEEREQRGGTSSWLAGVVVFQ
jgi:CHAT domain-containing protein